MNMSSKPLTQAQKNRVKWRAIISEWEESGLKQNEFCKSRCLDPKQFSYYRKRLLLSPAEPAKMLPIKLSPASLSKSMPIEPLTLYLSNKVTMTIPLPCDTQVLENILLAARNASC